MNKEKRTTKPASSRQNSRLTAVNAVKVSAGRQARRLILRRTMFLMVVCGVLMFLPILYKLWDWQINRHEEIGQKVISQQTNEYPVAALRGQITDVNGTPLAISSETYDVVVSAKAVAEKQEELNKKMLDAQKQVTHLRAKGKEPSQELLEAATTQP